MSRRKIKLPTGAVAEVVEHAPGPWFGIVPADLEDWDDTGEARFRLAATEAEWAEQIARNGEARKENARKVTIEGVRAGLVTLRRDRHTRVTMTRLATHLGCAERSILRALKAAGVEWKAL